MLENILTEIGEIPVKPFGAVLVKRSDPKVVGPEAGRFPGALLQAAKFVVQQLELGLDLIAMHTLATHNQYRLDSALQFRKKIIQIVFRQPLPRIRVNEMAHSD